MEQKRWVIDGFWDLFWRVGAGVVAGMLLTSVWSALTATRHEECVSGVRAFDEVGDSECFEYRWVAGPDRASAVLVSGVVLVVLFLGLSPASPLLKSEERVYRRKLSEVGIVGSDASGLVERARRTGKQWLVTFEEQLEYEKELKMHSSLDDVDRLLCMELYGRTRVKPDLDEYVSLMLGRREDAGDPT